MSRYKAKLVFDVDAELLPIANQLAFLTQEGARILEEEIKALIDISDFPAEAFQPPNSRGAFRDSFTTTKKAKRKRGSWLITSWTFSLARTKDATVQRGESLAEILDEGRGRIHPHPFLREAVRRAERRVEALVREHG